MPRPICTAMSALNRCDCFEKMTVASIGLPKYFAIAWSSDCATWVRSASPTSMFLPLTVRFMFVVQQTGVMPHSCPVGHSALDLGARPTAGRDHMYRPLPSQGRPPHQCWGNHVTRLRRNARTSRAVAGRKTEFLTILDI